jgi:prephenate dehydrogenase
MPNLNNTIHSTTIAGQIYSRGSAFYPPVYRDNFVRITTQNFQMLRQIARYEIETNKIQGFNLNNNKTFKY